MYTGKKLSLDFSTLALAVLIAFIVSIVFVLNGGCSRVSVGDEINPATSIVASVTADTLSAVSGTELPLRITLTNNSDAVVNDGAIIIAIIREPSEGDFSRDKQFILTRAVVKTGISIPTRSNIKLAFAWKIPTTLPSGVYRAEAAFLENGQLIDNSQVLTNNPFGNTAKIFISGEAKGAVFFTASLAGENEPNITLVNGTDKDATVSVMLNTHAGSLTGNIVNSESRQVFVKSDSSTNVEYLSPKGAFGVAAEALYGGVPAVYIYSSSKSSGCFDRSMLYSWAMLIGGLGFLMLLGVYLMEKSNHQ